MNLSISSTACLAATALMLGAAPAAYAQASPRAESLFRSGKQLMSDGKIAEACTAFEGSERLEHNVATVLSLADCREKAGQFASAWALFLQADSQTREEPAKAMLNRTSKQRAKTLESKLSFLTINVPDESRVPDLVITRDDAPVDLAEWNRAIPVDGGSHVISGKAPGHESWSTTIMVAPQTDHKSVEVPRFKALPELVNKPVPPAAAVAPITRPPPALASPVTRQRIIALGIVGLGVVAGGTGAYFGLDARSLRSEAVATCPPAACSPDDASRAQSLNDKAKRRGLYANVAFGVAAVAVITGGVLWFTGAPEAPLTVAPSVGDVTGASLVGQF